MLFLFFFSCFTCVCLYPFCPSPLNISWKDLIPCLSVLLFFHPQSDIYFVSSAPVSSASNCSSRDTSSQSSPQTPTGYEMPVFPSPLGDGKLLQSKKYQRMMILGLQCWRFLKCQCCLQTCLTLDALLTPSLRSIYINLSQQNGSWKLQPFPSRVTVSFLELNICVDI